MTVTGIARVCCSSFNPSIFSTASKTGTVTLAHVFENKSKVALFSVIEALSVGKNSAAWVRLGT